MAELVIRFRLPVVIVIIVFTAMLGSQIRFLTINTSNEGLLRENDPILEIYNEFRDQFGRDDMMAIVIHSKRYLFRRLSHPAQGIARGCGTRDPPR